MKLRPYQGEGRDAVLATEKGQVILPTGTGKSVIEGAVFEALIRMNEGFGIYAILTPRIMLTNQLMLDVGNHLIGNRIYPAALTIHSGKPVEFYGTDADDYTMAIYANIHNESTTSWEDVVVRIKDAREAKKPLLICCTYDSSPSLRRALQELEIKADQVICDE